MHINSITENFSVSEQITLDDVDTLKSLGVQLIICNRPDGEAADQTPFEEIKAKAENIGLEAVSIAFSGGQLTPELVEDFIDEIEKNKKTHAYCRTGNRSSTIWQASQQ